MWVLLAISSAFVLGLYDVFKKLSLDKNAVLVVLFFSSFAAALCVLPFIVGSHLVPSFFQAIHLYVPVISWHEHFLILIKTGIVVSSWIFAFFALKNLPITIVAPIRATGPLWTLVGAIILFQEKLNPMQWLGVSITLIFFYLLSTAGKLEGIHFRKNKWVFFIIIGTLLGAASGLYDKFIIHRVDRLAVQAWFSIYQVFLLGPVVLISRFSVPPPKRVKFHWRWTIPAIGMLLLLADFLYFYALSYENAMISIISALRRGGVVVAFVTGAFLFKEQNIKKKGVYLLGILAGILLISFASR